jgi:ferredoxin like protein
MSRMTIEEKLGLNKFVVDEGNPHIVIDQDKFNGFDVNALIRACPASLYKLDESGDLLFDFAGCLECGTCRVVCPKEAISWNHPRPTFGVLYRYG